MKQSDNWQKTCVTLGLLSACGTYFLLLLFPPWRVAVAIAVGILVYLFYSFRNPKYWSRRCFSILLGAWAGARLVPFAISVIAPEMSIHIAVGDSSNLYDIVIGLLALGLIAHDLLTNHGDQIGKIIAEKRWPYSRKQDLALHDQASIASFEGAHIYGTVNIAQGTSSQKLDRDADVVIARRNENDSREALNADAYDAEIDHIRDYLLNGKAEIAFELYQELRTRKWDQLKPRQRYRVLANLGHSCEALEKYDQAGRLFIEAKSHQPEDSTARALEAAGYDLLGNRSEALRLASEILDKDTHNPLAWAVRIRNEPNDEFISKIDGSLPETVRGSVEVLDALTHRARGLVSHETVESWIKKALTQQPENLQLKERMATAILHRFLGNGISERIEYVEREADKVKIAEAIKLLEDLLLKRREKGPTSAIARLRFNLGSAYRLLGERSKAASEYRESFVLSDRDGDTGCRLAYLLWSDGKTDESLAILTQIDKDKRTARGTALHAIILRERHSDGDSDNARHILEHALAALNNPQPDEIISLLDPLVDIYLENGQIDLAKNVIATHHKVIGELWRLIFQAKTLIAITDETGAQTCALAAIEALQQNHSVEDAGCLAALLERLRLYQAAAACIKPYIRQDRLTATGQRYLDLCQLGKDDQAVLDLCSALRDAGERNSRLVQLEVNVLERYHAYADALTLLKNVLREDIPLKVRRLFTFHHALVSFLSNDHQGSRPSLEDLPSPNDVEPESWSRIVGLLTAIGSRLEAAEFAYRALRDFPLVAKSHKALVYAVGPGDQFLEDFDSPTEVSLGVAVEYLAIGEDVTKWCVLEREPKSQLGVIEYGPESARTQELLGKKVGDEFIIDGSELQVVRGKIVRIVSKYIFRRNDCMAHWEERFPDEFFVKTIRFEKDEIGEMDFGPLFRSLDVREKQNETIVGIYNTNYCPVTLLATVRDASIVDAIHFLGQRSDTWIRCNRGSQEEIDGALALLADCREMVIDSVGLSTLFISGIFRVLPDQLPFQIIVTEGSISEFREIAERNKDYGNQRGWMGKSAGKYIFREFDEQDFASAKSHSEEFGKWIDRSTLRVDGLPLVKIDPAQRERMVELFGSGVAEAIAVAVDRNCPIWTDDFAIAVFSLKDHQRPRVWTEIVLRRLAMGDFINSDTTLNSLLRLIDMRYEFVPLFPDVVMLACRMANWSADDRPLCAVIDWFGNSNRVAEGVLKILASTLPKIWLEAPLHEQRVTITRSIGRKVLRNPKGRDIIRALHRNARELFGLDIVGSEHFKEELDHVLQLPADGRLFLPGVDF